MPGNVVDMSNDVRDIVGGLDTSHVGAPLGPTGDLEHADRPPVSAEDAVDPPPARSCSRRGRQQLLVVHEQVVTVLVVVHEQVSIGSLQQQSLQQHLLQ